MKNGAIKINNSNKFKFSFFFRFLFSLQVLQVTINMKTIHRFMNIQKETFKIIKLCVKSI